MLAAIPFPDLDPVLFSVTVFGQTFALRWYALAYIAGIVIGWRIAVAAVRRAALWPKSQAPLTPQQLEDFLTWAVIGIIVGGRLGYVLFYQPAYYLANPVLIPVIWEGGMAFHGGFAGVIVAAWLFARKYSVPVLSFADLLAVATPIGLMLGRLANFINAELWGRPTEVTWGVIFPGTAAQTCGQALGELCARHPSQLYQATLEGGLLAACLLWLAFRTDALRKPGLCFGVFLMGYGLARFVVELFRQPDAQFVTAGNPIGYALQLGGAGLTMGQLLSLPMIALGVWFVRKARA